MKNSEMKCFLLLLAMAGSFIILSGAVSTSNAYADILIVANKSVQTQSIKKAELKHIFLGNTIKWEDKTKINIVVHKDSKITSEFAKEILNKSTSQFRNYWKMMIFTGKGSTPKTFNRNGDLLAYIAATEGAIGYIAAATPPKGVKVIKVHD